MNEQVLKMSGERADVLSSRKKLRKTLWGVATTPPPPPFVRPRLKITFKLLHNNMNTSARLLCFQLFLNILGLSQHISRRQGLSSETRSVSLPLSSVSTFFACFLGCIGKNECFFNGSRIHSVSNLIAKARRNTTRPLE